MRSAAALTTTAPGAGLRPGARPWRPRVWRVLSRLLFGERAEPVGAGCPDTPTFGPEEAAAVERALGQWVRRQDAESTRVPARRVDSD